MRAVKIVGIVAGGVVGLLVVALLAVWLLVDPNDYKERIAAAVQESTGRSLSLPGELKLSLFPWIAIETGEAALGNPPGFGDEPFLTLRRAKLSVKLLPLLRSRLEVGRVEIDGLDLRLRQDAQGRGNWEQWGSDEQAAPAQEGGGPDGLTLAGLSITDSRIAFEDLVADQVQVKVGALSPGAAIPVELGMSLVTAPGEPPLPLTASFRVTPDIDRQFFQFDALDLRGRIQPEGAPAALDWRFQSPAAALDLAAQTLAETGFTAGIGAAELDGRIAGEQLVDAPALSGRFRLAELAPRDLLQQFGATAPITRDPAVLAKFSAEGAYAWRGGVARLSALKLVLDESQLAGRFAWHADNGAMEFALDLDRIDLDRYQPPPTDPAAATEPIELPVDFLKPLRAKGTFNVGEIRIGGARLARLSAGIDVADAVARFAPLRAQLYGGQYAGNIGLDMRGEVPRLTMDERMTGIDIAALMREYAGSERLSGRGNLAVQLAGEGRSGDALLRTLDGRITLDLADGAVEGMDVWYAIAQAQSLLRNRQLADARNQKRTAFDTFRASADVADGVATTRDMVVASQLLRISGVGSTNLVTKALDYTVTANVLRAPPDAGQDTQELVRAAIPVRITGTLDEPSIRPDLAGMAKERLKQEVEQRREAVEEKVKDKVKDRLRGLLGG